MTQRSSKRKISTAVEEAATRLAQAAQEEKTLQQKRFQEGERDRKKDLEKFREDNVSPPGAIPNLPPLLEARRLTHFIPDAYFRAHPCNDRINVFQIDGDGGDGEKFSEDSLLFKSDLGKAKSLQQAPKGILLGGGLRAMDHMYTNGYWIGHIINFCQANPWRMPIECVGGHRQYVQVMTCGDVSDSDDLAAYLRAGLVRHARRKYAIINDDGTEVSAVEHYLEDTQDGGVWDPSAAEMLEEEADA